MEKLLCPSVMCCDFGHLAQEISELDQAGADLFHCDIMDGCFVPNMTMGINDVRAVRQATGKPVEVHLMIEQPAEKVDWFIDAGADIITIHAEAERYVSKTLNHIRQRGRKAGLAINPDTPLSAVSELLGYCDTVTVMTVNPGFAGQPFVASAQHKIRELAALKQDHPFVLMVDGHCSPDVIRECGRLGADGFVLGTSALFDGSGRPWSEILAGLRRE